jgi:hypothetical protein
MQRPEEPADDREARLHHVTPLVGQLPLGEEGAIVELKARGLLGDVDIDRCPGKHSGHRERKLSSQHSPFSLIGVVRCCPLRSARMVTDSGEGFHDRGQRRLRRCRGYQRGADTDHASLRWLSPWRAYHCLPPDATANDTQ